MTGDGKWLSKKDIMELLNISASTFYRFYKENLRSELVGGRFLYSADSLEELRKTRRINKRRRYY